MTYMMIIPVDFTKIRLRLENKKMAYNVDPEEMLMNALKLNECAYSDQNVVGRLRYIEIL